MLSRCVYDKPVFSYRVHPEVAHSLLLHTVATQSVVNICRSGYQLHRLRGVQLYHCDVAVHTHLLSRWETLDYSDERCVVEYSSRPDGSHRLAIRCSSQWTETNAHVEIRPERFQLRLLVWEDSIRASARTRDNAHHSIAQPAVVKPPTLTEAVRIVGDQLFPFLPLMPRSPLLDRVVWHLAKNGLPDSPWDGTQYTWNQLSYSDRLQAARELLLLAAEERGWECRQIRTPVPTKPTRIHTHTSWRLHDIESGTVHDVASANERRLCRL